MNSTNDLDNCLIDEIYLCAINEKYIHNKCLSIYRKFITGYFTNLWLEASFNQVAKMYARKYARRWEIKVNDSEIVMIASLLKDYYNPNNYQ